MKRAGEMRVTRCDQCGGWLYIQGATALEAFTATGTATCRHCETARART